MWISLMCDIPYYSFENNNNNNNIYIYINGNNKTIIIKMATTEQCQ